MNAPSPAWSELDTASAELVRLRTGFSMMREEMDPPAGKMDPERVLFLLDACERMVEQADAVLTPLVDRLHRTGRAAA